MLIIAITVTMPVKERASLAPLSHTVKLLTLLMQGWCRGNVSVIGDAAHAGLPNGQGLNLAIEDGESNPLVASMRRNVGNRLCIWPCLSYLLRYGRPQAQSSLLRAGAVLGWHFREHGVSAEALRGFNAERGPRVKEVYTKVCITVCSMIVSMYCVIVPIAYAVPGQQT